MKMITVMRVIAQVIDIFVCFALMICSFMYVLPILSSVVHNTYLLAGLMALVVIAVIFAVEYPFLKVNQTIGKAFCSLEIVSTNQVRPLTLSILMQRELLCKLISCYFICLPLLAGQMGGHDVATETTVVVKRRTKRA